jgi:hypothetical protein
MLIDRDESVVVSNLGWVDKGAVWVCDTANSEARQLKLSDAKYLSLCEGNNGNFSAVHHFDNNRLDITAHEIIRPGQVLARIAIVDGKATFEGDIAVWGELPRAYVGYYTKPFAEGFFLFLVNAAARVVELQQFDWFDPR